jgi:hypothetical protein
VSTPQSMAAPLSSFPRSLTSWAPSPMHWPQDVRGLRGEGRGGRSGRISLEDGGGAWSRLGISAVLGKMQIESIVFSTVIAGLNNQRGGEKLLF